MTYQPVPVIQGDGSRFEWSNCTCAAAATSLDRDTKGASTTTGGAVRWLTGDTVGGTNLDQVDYALRRGFPPDDHLDTRRMLPFDDAVEMVAGGRGAVIQGGYRVFSGTVWDGSPGFMGNHAEYWNDVRLSLWPSGAIDYDESAAQVFDTLWDGRRPGIPTRQFRWIPLRKLRDFAGALVYNTAGDEVGNGYCYAGFTRDTEPTAPKPVVVPINFGSNTMLVAGGLTLSSSHVMALKQGQPLRRSPVSTSAVVTRMAKAGKVAYMGNADAGWKAVYVKTANFPDHKTRPVVLYVPADAGPVSAK